MGAVVQGLGRLLAYFYSLVPNYGVGIVLLTVVVRIMMIPLAVKQAHLMQSNRGNQEKIRKLQPEVKRLKEKYKDDRTRLYEEQKKLYDEHGVNMLGGLSGCLPLLLQTPIFMAMYQVLSGCNKLFGTGRKCVPGFNVPPTSPLRAAIVEGRTTFLGMNLNLRPSVVLQQGGMGRALPYYLLIAVMGITMWYQSRQMVKAQPAADPQMAQTQKLMQFMPLLLVFASLNFPAGLTVYWSATNLWTIGQQYVLLKKFGDATAQDEGPGGQRAAGGVGRGGRRESPSNGGGKGPGTGKGKQAASREGVAPARPAPAGKAKKRPGKSVATGPEKPKRSGAVGRTGERRPAARSARDVQGRGKGGVAGRQDGDRVEGGAGGSADGTGGGATAGGTGRSAPGTARPKGSGARKKSRGGRR